MTEKQNSRIALAEWLLREGRTKKWFAEQVGVPPETLSRWLSRQKPSAVARASIERITDGAVDRGGWS
jgi:DNA-binding transcriptional regulator YdaS (Cro superfamily)